MPPIFVTDVADALVQVVPHFVADLETRRIDRANAEAESLFGYVRNGLTGLDVNSLLPESYRETHSAHWSAFAKNPAPRLMRPVPLVGLKENGAEIHVSVLLYPIALGGRKKVIAVLFVVPDDKGSHGHSA